MERVESIALCMEVPGLQYYLFRRNFQDLQKSYIQGPNGYNAMLGELITAGAVESVAKEIRFPNGSRIYLCHCFTGDTLISTSEGPKAIKDLVRRKGYVSIAEGVQVPFRSVRKTRENAETVRVVFDDGVEVRCTPDHKFLTPNGPVEAKGLEGRLCQTNELKLSQIDYKSLRAKSTNSAESISGIARGGSTAPYGNFSMAKSRKAMKFITKILIEPITRSKIFKSYQALITENFMPILQRCLPKQQRTLEMEGVPQPIGTRLQKGLSGIRNRFWLSSLTGQVKNVFGAGRSFWDYETAGFAAVNVRGLAIDGISGTVSQRIVQSAEQNSQALSIDQIKPVVINAATSSKHKRCVSVKPGGNEDVYCLTVPHYGFFALANGVLVSNCQYEKDVFGFNSFEFHVLNIAEAGEFTPFMIRYLRSRVRMDKGFQRALPKKFLLPRQYWRSTNEPEYSLPKVTYTCNPVGPGKAYLKGQFVDAGKPVEKLFPLEPGEPRENQLWRAPDSEAGMIRQYIPAKLHDNPSLDPVSYAASLQGIGSRGYVEALLEGRWDATIGAFFPQIDRSKHLIKAFMIPQHWPRFMAYDHGACGGGDPFSVGWYTISDGSLPVYSSYTMEPMVCAAGALICYRRWNGTGLPKTNVVEIADGIRSREKEQILYRVAGGDIVEQRGMGEKDNAGKAWSESIFSLFAKHGIRFILADRRRQQGWGQVDYRLTGQNGNPLSFWFEECSEDLDELGNLQHDLHNPNDIGPGSDHDADRHRYACMTRAFPKEAPKEVRIDYRNPLLTPTPVQILSQLKKHKKSSYVTRG